MSPLTDDRTASALREHAQRVAPPLTYDADRVLALGRRRRTVRTASLAVGGVAGVALLMGGVVVAVNGLGDRPAGIDAASGEPSGAALTPELARAAEVLPLLGEAASAENALPAAVDVPSGDPASYRLVGTAHGDDVYAGLGADGEICMQVLGGGSQPLTGSCAEVDVFAQDGLNAATSEDGSTWATTLLVPQGYAGIPETWTRIGDHLVEAGAFPVNASGQTYGPAVLGPDGVPPDLIRFTGDDGVVGYVDRTAMETALGESAGSGAPVVVPLTTSDGTQQVSSRTLDAATLGQ